jgi:hypothetical protein
VQENGKNRKQAQASYHMVGISLPDGENGSIKLAQDVSDFLPFCHGAHARSGYK